MATKAKNGAGEFVRTALPKQFCNLDGAICAGAARARRHHRRTRPTRIFICRASTASPQGGRTRPYAVVLPATRPRNAILVVADYYLATFLTQRPGWRTSGRSGRD